MGSALILGRDTSLPGEILSKYLRSGKITKFFQFFLPDKAYHAPNSVRIYDPNTH